MKPNAAEDEYFAREQARKREKLAREEAERRKLEEAEALKKLHWMHCPKCGRELERVTTSLKGFQVDRCPSCHGIWFDKGEVEILKKGIEGPKGMAESVFALFRSKKPKPAGKDAQGKLKK